MRLSLTVGGHTNWNLTLITPIGLPPRTSERELQRMLKALPVALAGLVQEIERQNEECPEAVRVYLGGELRVVRAIAHIVVPDMLQRSSLQGPG